MRKSQGMPNLMGCKLPDSRQGDLQHRVFGPGERIGKQSLSNEIVLSHPKAPKTHMPLNDLTCSGIGICLYSTIL